MQLNLEEDCYCCRFKECTVFDTEGKELGQIYDVIQTKNNDVYWIKKTKRIINSSIKNIVTRY